MWTTGSSLRLLQAEEVEAGALEHLAVRGLEEVEPVLVDDLDFHAFPLLPAGGADGLLDLGLGVRGEGNAGGRRGFAGLAAAGTGEGHRRVVKAPIIMPADHGDHHRR